MTAGRVEARAYLGEVAGLPDVPGVLFYEGLNRQDALAAAGSLPDPLPTGTLIEVREVESASRETWRVAQPPDTGTIVDVREVVTDRAALFVVDDGGDLKEVPAPTAFTLSSDAENLALRGGFLHAWRSARLASSLLNWAGGIDRRLLIDAGLACAEHALPALRGATVMGATWLSRAVSVVAHVCRHYDAPDLRAYYLSVVVDVHAAIGRAQEDMDAGREARDVSPRGAGRHEPEFFWAAGYLCDLMLGRSGSAFSDASNAVFLAFHLEGGLRKLQADGYADGLADVVRRVVPFAEVARHALLPRPPAVATDTDAGTYHENPTFHELGWFRA